VWQEAILRAGFIRSAAERARVDLISWTSSWTRASPNPRNASVPSTSISPEVSIASGVSLAPRARLRSFSVNEVSPGRTRCHPVPEGHDQAREGGDRVLKEARDEHRPSDLDGGAADAADLELAALPPCDRDEEHRELLEFPHPRPLGRVVAPRAGPSIPRAKVLLLGAEAEEEDHDRSVGGDPCCSIRRGPPARHSPRIRAQPGAASARRSSDLRRGRPVVEAEVRSRGHFPAKTASKARQASSSSPLTTVTDRCASALGAGPLATVPSR